MRVGIRILLLLVCVLACNCTFTAYQSVFTSSQTFSLKYADGTTGTAVSTTSITGSTSYILGKINAVIVSITIGGNTYLIPSDGIEYSVINGLVSMSGANTAITGLYVTYFDSESLSTNTVIFTY